jgi:predicted enzyme related to lactoylglutathione lyase
MQASIGYVNVHVRDFPKALAFYRDALGFPLQFSDEGFHYARFDVGGMPFAVAASGEEASGPAEDRLTGIGITVPDVDAAFRELKSRGVRFTMEPSQQPWGGYMAMFADPDGNVFYLDKAGA